MAYVDARLLWPVVDYDKVDMGTGYMIKFSTRIKTTQVIDEKNLGVYEEIDTTNWRTSGLLQS